MIGSVTVVVLRVGVVVAVALVGAAAANLVLLGVASRPRDPVGRLSPRAGLVQLPANAHPVAPVAPPAPRRSDGHARGRADD